LKEVLMALKTTHSIKDGVVVIRLSGAIYFGEESTSLRVLVKELLEKSRQIVLDLGDVTHIDSGGLGTLVSLYASARKVGADIKLAHIGNHTRELLQITRLVTLFEVFDTVEDAMASFERAVATS
jgi:anti-sigma B factor antagonist